MRKELELRLSRTGYQVMCEVVQRGWCNDEEWQGQQNDESTIERRSVLEMVMG